MEEKSEKELEKEFKEDIKEFGWRKSGLYGKKINRKIKFNKFLMILIGVLIGVAIVAGVVLLLLR
jgi:hypothetical protein